MLKRFYPSIPTVTLQWMQKDTKAELVMVAPALSINVRRLKMEGVELESLDDT